MGELLLKTLVVLVGIAALAVLVLYAGKRLGLGQAAGPISLIGRLPLEPRRTLYLVRLGPKVLVVGASEAGLIKLGELSDDELEGSLTDEQAQAFSGALARAERQRGLGEGDAQS